MNKWILFGLVILVLAGYISFQLPGVQCSGSMIYCPGVGCVSGPDKCTGAGGSTAVFSKTWESFTSGKDMFPKPPRFTEVSATTLSDCPNHTRAPDGRCPKFLAP